MAFRLEQPVTGVNTQDAEPYEYLSIIYNDWCSGMSHMD